MVPGLCVYSAGRKPVSCSAKMSQPADYISGKRHLARGRLDVPGLGRDSRACTGYRAYAVRAAGQAAAVQAGKIYFMGSSIRILQCGMGLFPGR